MSRMAILSGATSLAEIPATPPERCHPLLGKRKGQFAVDVVHPCRLVFEPSLESVPLREDGGIDTERIDAIKILRIIDYH